jgi:hypothetical protein
MSTELLALNGVNGSSGAYLTPDLKSEDLAKVVQGLKIDRNDDHFQELEARKRSSEMGSHLGVASGVDANNLASAGWGVVFPTNIDLLIKEALKPLLEHRRAQAAQAKEHYYQEYQFGPNDTKQTFLRRYKAAPGPADPEKMPYYLLLVGDPQQIPYRFQYQLDVQYAVGRLHLNTPEEYAQYAQSVIAVETGQAAQLPRRATFFGVRNDDDRATNLSADNLVKPVVDKLRQIQAEPNWQGRGKPQWNIDMLLHNEATKARLAQLLGGDATPALLFTASHGMGFDLGDPRQLEHQGALLCQNWPGPLQWREKIPQDHYFAYDDLDSNARLLGLIAVFFACYGAGTPQMDEFNQRAYSQPKLIAPHDFSARLPQRMLGHPKGGALAVVGHVERAWGYSFMWEGVGAHTVAFESLLADLLRDGHTVGAALEYFNERYAELASDLSMELENIQFFNKIPNELALVGMWTANNDSRSYVILGDPAVRLPVGDEDANPAERPAIGAISPVQPKSESPIPPAPPEPSPAPTDPTRSGDGALAITEPASAAAAQFGLVGSNNKIQQVQERLVHTLQQMTEQLGEALARAADNARGLEVRTYVSDNLAEVKYENGEFVGNASLRALTRISSDQDIALCVPKQADEADRALWAIHAEMVQQAQANRTEMLEAVVSMVSQLLGTLQRSQ